RLMNMGVEPFLVATSVHLVVAQRLVRRICSYCKEPIEQPPAGLTEVGFYEVMEIDDELREMILAGASAFELRQRSLAKGMMGLRGSGLEKIRQGVTTIDEVVRETVD